MIDLDGQGNRYRNTWQSFEAESARTADLRQNLTSREREVLSLKSPDKSLERVLIDEQTISGDFGWVFFYESRAYLESGNLSDMLLGNVPIIVDGNLHETGTAHSIEVYIDNFVQTGNPREEA